MKVFIKDSINNLRSSHYFVITNENDDDKKTISGQMLRDINFSLLGVQDQIIRLSLCFGHPENIGRTIDFDYVVDINEKKQYFESNNELLEMEFDYSEHEEKYIICCPSFILKK